MVMLAQPYLLFYTLQLVVCNVGKLTFLIVLIIANRNRQHRRFLVPEHFWLLFVSSSIDQPYQSVLWLQKRKAEMLI